MRKITAPGDRERWSKNRLEPLKEGQLNLSLRVIQPMTGQKLTGGGASKLRSGEGPNLKKFRVSTVKKCLRDPFTGELN